MDKLKLACEWCGSLNLICRVEVTLSFPVKYVNHLTKKAIRDSDVKLEAAFWDKQRIWCADCNKRNRRWE